MKTCWIAFALSTLVFTGCSGQKNQTTPPANQNQQSQQPATQPSTSKPADTELSSEGHSVLLQFYSFYALKDEAGFNEWLQNTFVKPEDYRASFKKLFNPGMFTNVAVEFSGFKAEPSGTNQVQVTSNIKLHLINKPKNTEDVTDRKITLKTQKDESSGTLKIISYEETKL